MKANFFNKYHISKYAKGWNDYTDTQTETPDTISVLEICEYTGIELSFDKIKIKNGGAQLVGM